MVVTFHHGRSPELYARSRLDTALLRVLLRLVGGAIALTPEMAEFLRALAPAGRVHGSSSLVAVPEFGPSAGAPRHATAWMSADIADWVVTSGYETEIYGYLELLEAVASSGAECGLVLCTYGPPDDAYLGRLTRRAEELGVPLERVRGLTRDDFLRVLGEGSVYVRNTSTDTYGLAVAEALAAGLPVVATDVCARPEGVGLVRSGDAAALTTALKDALRNGPHDQAARRQRLEGLAQSASRALDAVEHCYLSRLASEGEVSGPARP
jgi:glycosyltransferase involved in cell wall biosynthesis